MQLLRTLVWVVIAVLLTIFARNNWNDVTVSLWGDLQADVKLPLLIVVAWAVGFLPPYLVLRGRLWRVQRKLSVQQQLGSASPPPAEAGTIDGASEGLAL